MYRMFAVVNINCHFCDTLIRCKYSKKVSISSGKTYFY